MLRTRLTEMFGLRYPIVAAPMARRSDGALAAAIVEAGGLGSISGMNEGGPDWVRQEIRRVRAKTERPFMVGFITSLTDEDNFAVCIEEKVPILFFSFGDARPLMERAKAAGIQTICQVQTVEGARWGLEGGADVLVAQGNEAGGHSGYLNTLPCLGLVLEIAGDTPVLAAGGIASGRSLAAVLAAGAEGALLGTALLATPEAAAVADSFKELIVQSNGEDTVHTRVFDIIGGRPWPPGIGDRVRRDNRLLDEWSGRESELAEHAESLRLIVAEATKRADPQVAPVLYGQSAGFVDSVRPVAEVIRSICDDAERTLRSRLEKVLSP